MTLDERIALRARLTSIRGDWLQLERDAGEILDDDFESWLVQTRLAMLAAADRLDQLNGIYDLDEAAAA